MADVFDFYVQDNRKITFEIAEPIMREDNGVTDFQFHVPKTINGLDMTGWAWWFVFVNADKHKYTEPLVLTDDPERPLEYSVGTYTVDYGMSIKAGNVSFALEAINSDTGGTILNEWHTFTYQTTVKETLQGNQVDYDETQSDIISALLIEVQKKVNQLVGGATPTPVSSVSEMLDTNKLYLLTTDGEWYFHNGTTWVSGGVYGAGVVDLVPTQGSVNAVSSGGVYTALEDKADKDSTPKIATPEETEADLYVCDSNGNVIAEFADGHIKTKNFDSSNIDVDSPIKEASKTEADLYICDSFGNVIAEFANGHIKTKNFDSENASEEILQEVQEELETLADDVSALQTATSGIIYRNKDVTDGVYAICRWHQPTLTSKEFCMLLSADIHNDVPSGKTDSPRMLSIIEYLNAVDAFDAGILLGDIVSDNWDNQFRHAHAISLAEKPFLVVIGNHDVGAGSTTSGYTDIDDVYDKYYAPTIEYADLSVSEHTGKNTYYYKDFSEQKIRIIVLNQYDYPSDYDSVNNQFVYQRGKECYSQNQIDWFCGVLSNTPSDYGVIVAVHMFPAKMTLDKTHILTSSTASATWTNQTIMDSANGYIIEEIVEAWINGTSLTEEFNYLVSGSWGQGISVDADFTSRGSGEFISYIGGHFHMSIVCKTQKYEQPYYSTPTAGIAAAKQGDTPRVEGTRSEDNFCAFAVDRTNRKVKIIQVGAHFTKDAIDRLLGSYEY